MKCILHIDKFRQNYIDKISRLFLSIFFFFSSIGKLIHPVTSARIVQNLFHLPYLIALIALILWAIFEIALAIIVWRKSLHPLFLIVPVILTVTFIFAHQKALDCGCFGSLPLLNQLSFSQHLFLLAGISLSLLYLTNYSKPRRATSKSEEKLSNPAFVISLIALAFMVIFVFSIGASYFNNNSHDSSIQIIARQELMKQLESGKNILIIDARPAFQYEMGHISSAINIPYDARNLSAKVKESQLLQKELIVYCSNCHCHAAAILTNRLKNAGCKNILIYEGGWEEWQGG